MVRQNDPIKEMIAKILEFREKRDWRKFHNPKDLSISLNLEASELLEHFLWKDKKEVEEYVKTNKDEISDELADILHNLLLLTHDLEIDIVDVFHKKLEKNAKKYPIEKVKGKHYKYTEYK